MIYRGRSYGWVLMLGIKYGKRHYSDYEMPSDWDDIQDFLKYIYCYFSTPPESNIMEIHSQNTSSSLSQISMDGLIWVHRQDGEVPSQSTFSFGAPDPNILGNPSTAAENSSPGCSKHHHEPTTNDDSSEVEITAPPKLLNKIPLGLVCKF